MGDPDNCLDEDFQKEVSSLARPKLGVIKVNHEMVISSSIYFRRRDFSPENTEL